MRRGVSFKIPNNYGTYLLEILKPIELSRYMWFILGEESYTVRDDELSELLFHEPTVMDGEAFGDLISQDQHYLIFLNLKAFPAGPVTDVETYEAFLDSPCEFALLIVDSTFVDIYCKNQRMIESFYDHALSCEFKEVAYLTDANDMRTTLTIW
ncbi:MULTISPECIES: DUF2691 family protein [unclassified Exiguobacterium]|uniref:DUF2691 family protein n=1 Tax=unclassified Exiguobacterium TaxID=2644629 RepID=UPI00103CCF9A|nr:MULTISPECIES: DUF2691 family protein [unclassified Exiguobacterium]TCI33508.1 DUF2691 family protein [Exiguobacterium sp. SH4S7]TCI42823.1 DUF2691 family protein [Exiguobacterium sp. SH5S32]TCI50164.1 DUF2691 family protein [Exiguobacterium sp. SH1S4]TCI53014.1 DUF2691 family protein [Exiguobacterium sp. SH1S21]TCI67547.1 DUF2691 family protein [Exiguobacterium sp. SH1S1]